ncbi:Outer membrane protein assembly factor BamA [bacterium HR21]|nr:Outer membrane protein assembly factor BamA [bacterium HR21]
MPGMSRWARAGCVLVALALSTAQPLHGQAEVLERIEFVDNTAFSSDELLPLLQLRAAQRGFFHRLVRSYVRALASNPATPATLLGHLQRLENQLESELPSFDPRLLEGDLETLRRFYTQQGFHWAQIQAQLVRQPDRAVVLRFLIEEGPAARIDTLLYLGLEEVPAEIRRELQQLRRLRPGMRFRESALLEELEALRRLLRERGYAHATYERPQIYILSERNADSILVRFSPGPRLRFGALHFVETTTNAPPLTERIRRFCTEFQPGQWYDIRAVERTRLRLLRLGVFEMVRIDTLPSTGTGTLDLLATTRYRRFQETLLGASLYRTALESAPNLGVELQLSNVNLFGGAEKGQLLGRIGLRDPLGSLERGQLEYEFQLSAGLTFPYLLRRVGLSSQLSYGIRALVWPLRLEALAVQLRLPVEFAPWTWMTTTELTVDIRAERPVDYPRAAAAVDTVPALAPFLRQYERLYAYTHRGTRLFPPSDITMSLLLGADHRDHPATPNSGHTVLATLDIGGVGAIGLAQYVRLQTLLLGFLPLRHGSVLAGKLRIGRIWWRNRENSYVPYDRHFFAGGANSVRGWASRSLWDPASGGIQSGIGSALASYIGGALLIEGSGELRWRLPPLRLGPLSPYVEKLVLVTFLDWGNAYDRLTPQLYGTATVGDIFRNLALSAGLGIGYLTDVGPIRVDAALRLHDPLNASAPWIFQRSAALRQWSFHLGLGYAF